MQSPPGTSPLCFPHQHSLAYKKNVCGGERNGGWIYVGKENEVVNFSSIETLTITISDLMMTTHGVYSESTGDGWGWSSVQGATACVRP